MIHTREQIADWLDEYFEAVSAHQGDPESVISLRDYFTEDLEFRMYTAAGSEFMSAPLGRAELLVSFIHPGLIEKISPRYYVIDVGEMKAVVQFSIVFCDEGSGKEWPEIQASGHYHLRSDTTGGLRIAKIQYWTAIFGQEFIPMFAQWEKAREDAIAGLGSDLFQRF